MPRFEVIGDAAPAINNEKEKVISSKKPSVPRLPNQSSKTDKVDELNSEKPDKKIIVVDLIIDD